MTDRLEKLEPDPEFDWPFDRLALSVPSREILERFWFQISQRRPFKYAFPDMYEKEPSEFNEMFRDIADTIDRTFLEAFGPEPITLATEIDKIAERIFARLLKGEFVDLKALIGVAVRKGAEAAQKHDG